MFTRFTVRSCRRPSLQLQLQHCGKCVLFVPWIGALVSKEKKMDGAKSWWKAAASARKLNIGRLFKLSVWQHPLARCNRANSGWMTGRTMSMSGGVRVLTQVFKKSLEWIELDSPSTVTMHIHVDNNEWGIENKKIYMKKYELLFKVWVGKIFFIVSYAYQAVFI